MELPKIIQGGMGIGVSGWRLASAVAVSGQMGVVSGICLDEVLVRKLQIGDPGGHVRRALSNFPVKDIAKSIVDKFHKEKSACESFIQNTLHDLRMTKEREDLIVAGSFTEIYLAKEGHHGLVGVNFMEKIQTECMAALYGCMLAGVDFVTMGAGIPKDIPGIIDILSQNEKAKLKLHVDGAIAEDDFCMTFDPERFQQKEPLYRPKFYAVISSSVLAITLAKKSTGKVDGFVIEGPIAGGHNAPSRSSKELTSDGEPIYGAKDEVDLKKVAELGLPYWLAGGYGRRGKLKEALALGAAGVQVGSPFALCEESALADHLKEQIFNSERKVITDVNASPTGFPFKVVELKGSLSEKEVFEERPRRCNLGYLRTRYKAADGSMATRCPAEPVKAFVSKGGDIKDAVSSKCLCNALFANIGLGSVYKDGYKELPLVTAGQSLHELDYMRLGIKASEVIEHILSGI